MLRRIVEYRANKILYNFIVSNQLQGIAVLPVNICSDVVDTLMCAGMQVRYVDISPCTFCMDEEEVMAWVDKAKMILYVHTYGIENNPDDFFKRIKERNSDVVIVDDRCLCIPQQVKHSCADVVLFSTGAKKVIDLGLGGMGYICDKWNYENVHEPSGLLLDLDYKVDKNWFNDQYQISMSHKMRLNDIYRKNLPKKIQFSQNYQKWRFNILVEDKNRVLQAIFEDGLFASGHYKPMENGFKMADSLYKHVINLFNDRYYSEEQAIRTCEIINNLN